MRFSSAISSGVTSTWALSAFRARAQSSDSGTRHVLEPEVWVFRCSVHQAGFSTVQTEAQIGPPMLKVAAARAFFTCSCFGTLP